MLHRIYKYLLVPVLCQSCVTASTDYNPNFVKIERDKHYFRHFQWSGIPPLYGGFMPDPHMSYSKVYELNYQGQHYRFQFFDINEHFEDKSTREGVLAFETNGKVKEIPVPMKKEHDRFNLSFGYENLGIMIAKNAFVAYLQVLETNDKSVGGSNREWTHLLIYFSQDGETFEAARFGEENYDKIFKKIDASKIHLSKGFFCDSQMKTKIKFYDQHWGCS